MEKTYECGECEKDFFIRHTLLDIRESKVWKNPFECRECVKAFSHMSHLIIDQSIHTGENL